MNPLAATVMRSSAAIASAAQRMRTRSTLSVCHVDGRTAWCDGSVAVPLSHAEREIAAGAVDLRMSFEVGADASVHCGASYTPGRALSPAELAIAAAIVDWRWSWEMCDESS